MGTRAPANAEGPAPLGGGSRSKISSMAAGGANERFLVTGALGCIGAWVARLLLSGDAEVVAFDPGASDHRLRLILTPEQLGRVVRIPGDVTSLEALGRALDDYEVTHVIHLAALQVPSCREDPPLGAAVNVVGTANVFEAVKRRRQRIGKVVYASSAAVYAEGGGEGPAPEAALERPATHYGVYKLANEGAARIFWQDDGVPSVALRPYVVYGPGRDQGLTSAPTAAMAAAARGESAHIPFGGRMQLQFAPDVARAFVAASRADSDGAVVANVPSPAVHMREVVDAIAAAAPGTSVTYDDVPLPFPAELEARALEGVVGRLPLTPLAEGVRATIEHLRRAAAGETGQRGRAG
jgi:nucleoside-diphosphate-sugar epimerase